MEKQEVMPHFKIRGRGSAYAEIKKGVLSIPIRKCDFYFPPGEYIPIRYELGNYTCLAVIPKQVWEKELPYMKNTSQELLIPDEDRKPVDLETIISERELKIRGLPIANLGSLGLKDGSKIVVAKLDGYFVLWMPEDFREINSNLDVNRMVEELDLDL